MPHIRCFCGGRRITLEANLNSGCLCPMRRVAAWTSRASSQCSRFGAAPSLEGTAPECVQCRCRGRIKQQIHGGPRKAELFSHPPAGNPSQRERHLAAAGGVIGVVRPAHPHGEGSMELK